MDKFKEIFADCLTPRQAHNVNQQFLRKNGDFNLLIDKASWKARVAVFLESLETHDQRPFSDRKS